MNYQKFITGPIETNTYIVLGDDENDKTCIVIDPAEGCGEVIDYMQKNSLTPIAILLTHGHFDHIMGVSEIVDVYNDAQVFIHDGDKDRLTNPTRNGSPLVGKEYTLTRNVTPLVDGALTIGNFSLTVLHVPGHTQGCCSFLFDCVTPNVCFCGDTVFANSIGRTDLGGGDFDQIIKSISTKILPLAPETVLCPGHGGRTTVGRESTRNPYLKDLTK